MATKKLRERLGMVSAAGPVVPELSVPPTDKAGALVEAAESGFAAIQSLYADRNRSVELAQGLHRETVYLRNVNNGLRAQVHHAQLERDHYMRLNATIRAWAIQAHDLLGRIVGEMGHTAEVIEHLAPADEITNNPEVPPLDTNGLPVQPKEGFDENGVPVNGSGAKTVSAEELQHLIGQLGRAEAAHA